MAIFNGPDVVFACQVLGFVDNARAPATETAQYFLCLLGMSIAGAPNVSDRIWKSLECDGRPFHTYSSSIEFA